MEYSHNNVLISLSTIIEDVTFRFLSSLSVQFSPENSSCLVFSDSQLCILSSLSLPGFAWVPSLCAMAWKLSPGNKLGQL